MEQLIIDQDVTKVLENNNNLSKDYQFGMEILLSLFMKNFPNYNMENCMKRLETIKVSPVSKFLSKNPIQYKSKQNVIEVNQESSQKIDDYEAIQLLGETTLDVITTANEKDNNYEAINVGIRSIITNYLLASVDYPSEGYNSNYMDEQIITNLLGRIIGENVLLDFYLNNDTKIIENKITELGINIDDLKRFLNSANYNLNARNFTGKSNLATLQKQLTNMFFQKSMLNLREIKAFRENLFGNDNVLSNQNLYGDLVTVYENFDDHFKKLEGNLESDVKVNIFSR